MNPSRIFSWRPSGDLQKTIKKSIEISGTSLHSGQHTQVRILPAKAGEGRYFLCNSHKIPASFHFSIPTPLRTTLVKNQYKIQTVEHLLSALEATGVDNCRIELHSPTHPLSEPPILDGSAEPWLRAILEAGVEPAVDSWGKHLEKMEAVLERAVYVQKNGSFVMALPSATPLLTCGIDFPEVKEMRKQWYSVEPLDLSLYCKEIACCRTFCVYEEVGRMRKNGFVKGGCLENAIVCSRINGWMNDLYFEDEACRHKVLDLIGDLSLFAVGGSRGIPVAHVVAYMAGHSLHTRFMRTLAGEDGEEDQV